ncbi:tyrosine-type recombinase/integrase [Bacillus sp. AFS037270]|uniref:tyrosine-type recombinase/integrase n=1 Tax=Bacillus sp. AFS037270 TaxID=2033499 RepID=UPI000BFBEE5E|nr:tyrosine-type recombinase/integrase [Bacillus sp. AFS037270]PGV47024.1 site-specific integrase [Bacillus sp. AFS037270]
MHIYKPRCKCEGKKCKCGASWAYIVDVGKDPKTGKRKQKKKSGFRTKKEAEAAAAIINNEINQGLYIEESDVTFEDFAYEWLSLYEGTGIVKESTVRIRKHEIKRLYDYFAKLKLKDITRRQYQNALNDLKKRGYAQNTIEGAHRTGRMIFKKAVELEILKKDPTEYTQVPRQQITIAELEEQNGLPNYLEKKELKHFLNIAKKFGLDQDYPIFLLMAYTGLRAGELCALKWRDIDFEAHTISISKTYYNPTNNKKEYKLLTPKTPTSVRIIDIDEIVINELSKHKVVQKQTMMKYRDIYHSEDFVFASIDEDLPGYPLYIKKIENRMRRLLKIAELNPEHTPHSLRHTHTSLLAEAGVSLPQIMERLGHKDEDTTKNVYLHVTKEMKKEASQKFKELMENL